TFGSWAYKVFKDEKKYMIDWKILVGGVIALAIIGLIPLLGWFVVLIFTLINLGAIYRMLVKIK
ncbi:hypothetical protein ACFL05_00945, partial [Patescibacteria group bacterium]